MKCVDGYHNVIPNVMHNESACWLTWPRAGDAPRLASCNMYSRESARACAVTASESRRGEPDSCHVFPCS